MTTFGSMVHEIDGRTGRGVERSRSIASVNRGEALRNVIVFP
jgi:hypothetical protein